MNYESYFTGGPKHGEILILNEKLPEFLFPCDDPVDLRMIGANEETPKPTFNCISYRYLCTTENGRLIYEYQG